MNELTLYEQHPTMFRHRPVSFVLCMVLSLAGIGLIILLAWWLKVKGTKLTVTGERTILRLGLFSKSINEVYHSDIRNVRIHQSFLQRIFNVGNISIASAGSGIAEIEVAGIPSPDEVKLILDESRRAARMRTQE